MPTINYNSLHLHFTLEFVQQVKLEIAQLFILE